MHLQESACPCGHRLEFCHISQAKRWCGGVDVPATAVVENERYREFFLKIATAAGEDVSDGPPTWPAIEVWALQAVEELRRGRRGRLGLSYTIKTDPDDLDLWQVIRDSDRKVMLRDRLGVCLRWVKTWGAVDLGR